MRSSDRGWLRGQEQVRIGSPLFPQSRDSEDRRARDAVARVEKAESREIQPNPTCSRVMLALGEGRGRLEAEGVEGPNPGKSNQIQLVLVRDWLVGRTRVVGSGGVEGRIQVNPTKSNLFSCEIGSWRRTRAVGSADGLSGFRVSDSRHFHRIAGPGDFYSRFSTGCSHLTALRQGGVGIIGIRGIMIFRARTLARGAFPRGCGVMMGA